MSRITWILSKSTTSRMLHGSSSRKPIVLHLPSAKPARQLAILLAASTSRIAPAFSAKIDALCDTGSSTKAFASVCISGRFVVRDIAVMEGKNGLFARMPCRSYQDRHGNTHYSDTFFPLNANDRTAINEAVLSAYQQELEQSEAEGLDESEDASEGMAPQM